MDSELLSALQRQLHEERLVKTTEDLKVGDVIYVEMDKNDGLVLNDGYNTRLKYVVVAGSKNNGKEYGVVLINSNADYSDSPDWRKEQYPLMQSEYKEFLERDSWVDCTDPKELTLRKMKAKQAEKIGRLTDADINRIMEIMRNSDFIEPHFKKVYGISVGK